jgi:GH18 family chitinase
LVASAERRSQLVKNSIKFLRQNKFDGLDLDWGKYSALHNRPAVILNDYMNFQNILLTVTVERRKIVRTTQNGFKNFAKNSKENTTKPDVRDYC